MPQELLSVDEALVLARCGVGCPDRQAPAIAGHAGDLPLGVAVGAVQRVQDLHPGQREAARDLEPAQEGLRLLGEAGGHEGTRPDPGITWPGIAVVPVELAAQLFGQRHCRSCHRSAGWRIREQAQRDQTSDNRWAKWSRILNLRHPATPLSIRLLK